LKIWKINLNSIWVETELRVADITKTFGSCGSESVTEKMLKTFSATTLT
jgi:hypothetical protein